MNGGVRSYHCPYRAAVVALHICNGLFQSSHLSRVPLPLPGASESLVTHYSTLNSYLEPAAATSSRSCQWTAGGCGGSDAVCSSHSSYQAGAWPMGIRISNLMFGIELNSRDWWRLVTPDSCNWLASSASLLCVCVCLCIYVCEDWLPDPIVHDMPTSPFLNVYYKT